MANEINYNYLDLLNPQQRDAVVYKDGPSLVIAGAGSGKTRVLTYKIVDLLHSGYEAYRIMALTFTNKAAREMKSRVAAVVGEKVAAKLWMGTFHSVFLKILRRHAELIGFKAGFTIYDTSDSRSLIKSIIKELALDEKIYKPTAIASVISNAKNAMQSPSDYRADRSNYDLDRKARRPLTGDIYEMYFERCRRANAMDFDDILYYTNLLLRDNPDVKRHYREFFRYILVDEYQDTNFAQHLVVSQLTDDANHICVVGDDAQSIYSFRGANIHNILNLDRYYPGLRIFKLERNYRSTQNIVNAAGSLIAKNADQMPKNVFSENDEGEKIEVIRTYSDMEEAYVVAGKISEFKLTYHDSYEDYAVLYRTNAQSRILEESLRKRNIPYRIYGSLSFYQRKEIKDVICYFRLTINPDDDEALKRIINYPARGIGETTLKKLQADASQHNRSLWQTLNDLNPAELKINSGTVAKLAAFRDMIQAFINDNDMGSNAYDLARLIYNRTGILSQFIHDTTPETISKQENLKEMLSGLKDFVDIKQESGEKDDSMRAFLSEVMLATDQDEKDATDEPKITLMTAHAAKGLEFKHIFIVGVEEDLFPSAMSLDTIAGVEEERRLLYVAMTRAKETCVITYASSRFRNGQTAISRPSRFLRDIDPKYLKVVSSSDLGPSAGDRKFINPVASYSRAESKRQWSSGYARDEVAGTRYEDSQYRFRGSSRAGRSSALSGNISPSTPGDSPKLSRISAGAGESSPISPDLAVGTRISHQKFGEGTIVDLDNVAGQPSIIVDFGPVGIKKLLLKFAKFSIVK